MRQLWDWKRSAEIESLSPPGFEVYARICGWTLARAHAGDHEALLAAIGEGRIEAVDA